MIEEIEKNSKLELKEVFENIEDICSYNSKKVLDAFIKNSVTTCHFNLTTGYGYNDEGRTVIEKIYSDVFKCEDALVRCQLISGTHAITTTLFALLRPGDTLLSISGKPYDTLDEVIGIKENNSSLKSFGINFEQIELIDNDFDYESIEKTLKEKAIKVIEIQRSKGYSTRKSISLSKVEKIIKFIRSISPNVIIMIDNCYCEFVSKQEPTEVGADIVVGSLIKNLGAGIATNGGYICGRADLINLCAERLNVPGEAKEVGPTTMNREILLGLYMAPKVVGEALKTSIYTAYILEKLGYNVEPKYNEERVDIVENIIFNDEEKLIKYVQGIQKYSPVDSNAIPIPDDMPGYDDKVIMASGAFTQGSSIEMSCDGPIRPPFIAYQQGSLTFEYGKLIVDQAIKNILE